MRMMIRAGAIAVIIAAGCGATGDANGVDGGVDPRCEMRIDGYAPLDPTVGDTIDVDGAITKQDVSGIEAYDFFITGPTGSDPTPRMRFPNDDALIEFDAAVAGTYRIELRGEVGGLSCTDDVLSVYVANPGATNNAFRFRFVPAAIQPAPAQDKVLEIPGGAADYPLNVVGLDNGLIITGAVQDTTGVPAYVRLTRSFDGSVTETFADAGGAVDTRLLAGDYDILVVPEAAAIAPAAFARTINAPISLDLSLPAADTVTGTVVDGGGQPVVGAQVSLRIDGVPSTAGITDGTGAFSLLARTGGATAVTVTPPAGSGLPRLELAATAGLVAATAEPLAIAYAGGLTSRTLSTTLVAADGSTPMAGASATLILRPMTAAGTITPAGGSALSAAGGHRVTVTADGAGAIASSLPDGNYDVIVRSLAGVASLRAVDLSSGQADPASIAAAAPAELGGRVLDGTAGVEGARITARPRGLLASEPIAGAVAVSGADGSYTLDVVGGGDYELVVEPPAAFARAVLTGVQAPAAGAQGSVGDRTLDPAIRVTGKVAIPGYSQPGGITVQVFCTACAGTAAQTPLAEAVTAADGGFAVSIPDPDPDGGS